MATLDQLEESGLYVALEDGHVTYYLKAGGDWFDLTRTMESQLSESEQERIWVELSERKDRDESQAEWIRQELLGGKR